MGKAQHTALSMLLLAGLGAWGFGLQAEEQAGKDGYTLHEWGVFTVPRNDAWAQRDMRAEWASFPKFFYGTFPKKHLPYRGPVAKPVIYFHAKKALKVKLTVRFAEGIPLVWWPAQASFRKAWVPAQAALIKKDRLSFECHLVDVANQRARGKLPPVKKGHWIETLRAVHGSAVFVRGSHSQAKLIYERENFIYYDGLMKAPAAPKVTREGEAVVLETNSTHPWLDVMAIERSGKRTRFAEGWTERIEPSRRKTRIKLLEAADGRGAARVLAKLGAELQERLAKAGLNADEAGALVKVWEQGLFHGDGLTVFYRIPQATYEKWLPLTAQPAPRRTVRVGLVVHRHLEPELETRVEALIEKLGAKDFETRRGAREELARIGGAAFPQLEKHAHDTDEETASACRALLKALDAKPALGKRK